MNINYPSATVFPVSEAELTDKMRLAIRRVYAWMTLGLVVTAGMAFLVVNTPLLYIVANRWVFYGCLIGEIALVWGLSATIGRLSPTVALAVFLGYAALNGVTLSLIFAIYTASSIVMTFVATASLFGAMTLVGYTTQLDLSRVGGFLTMALLGLVIASVINLFFASNALYWIITYAGVVIFIGLTAYNTQRIKAMTIAAIQSGDEALEQRIGIMGALTLYLDFVNLFLLLLRIVGNRRR